MSLKNTQLNAPPKFSIANALGIGDVPACFKDASSAEIRMVTLAPISGIIKINGRARLEAWLGVHKTFVSAAFVVVVVHLSDIVVASISFGF
jgi:hypothetical protein